MPNEEASELLATESGAQPDDNGDLANASPRCAVGAPPSSLCELLWSALSVQYSGAPLWAWLQLCFATVCVSFAGLGFVLAKDVPPFLLASWRLLTVSVLLAPLAVRDWKQLLPELRLRFQQHAAAIAAAGLALGVHFGAWVTATQTTSLPHALLLVSTTPLVLAGWALSHGHPLSRGELGGSAAAVAGVALLVSDRGSDAAVTLRGDCAAFLAAAAFSLYLSVGGRVRPWCPLYLYAVAVYGCAAVSLQAAALLTEHASPFAAGRHGLLGFLTVRKYAAIIFALAAGPGIGGHLSFNAVLGAGIKPLTLSMLLTCEPLLGAFVGWAAGVSAQPHARTYAGGCVLLASTLVVIRAEGRRRAAEAGAVEVSADGAAESETARDVELVSPSEI
jgi:drug/metabolite transporter (DMT)-like permease